MVHHCWHNFSEITYNFRIAVYYFDRLAHKMCRSVKILDWNSDIFLKFWSFQDAPTVVFSTENTFVSVNKLFFELQSP